MKKTTGLLCLSVFICVLIICILFPVRLSGLVRKSLDMCINSIVPSLFPFMVIGNIFSRTNIAINAGKCISFTLSPLLGIPKELSGAFIIGMFGGVPNGVHSAGISYSKGDCTKNEAERCIAISNNCSMPFIITIAGIHATGSINNGLLLITAQIISTIIVSFVIRLVFPYQDTDLISNKKSSNCYDKSFSAILCQSIKDSCINMINICGYISVFFIMSSIISELSILKNTASVLIKGAFEMSNGIISASTIPFPLNIIICSVIIGFTGLSAIFQVTDAAEKYGLSSKQYVFGRIVNAVAMPLVTTILILTLPPHCVSAFSDFNNQLYYANYNLKSVAILYAVLFFIVMMFLSTIYLIVTLFERKVRYNKNNNKLTQKNMH